MRVKWSASASQKSADWSKMVTAIILSGGIGSRMKTDGFPKQYIEIHGRPIISYSLKTFNECPKIDKIVIIADISWWDKISEWINKENISKFAGFADPGETRQYSIINGLKEIERFGGTDKVIIHDAARPLVSSKLITACLENLDDCDGVMPVLPAKDTFYLLDGHGMASKLLPRSLLAAGQSPEAFVYMKYYDANMSLSHDEILKINGSSELALKCGLTVKTVPGDERNIKITTPNDLTLLEAYMEEEK